MDGIFQYETHDDLSFSSDLKVFQNFLNIFAKKDHNDWPVAVVRNTYLYQWRLNNICASLDGAG